MPSVQSVCAPFAALISALVCVGKLGSRLICWLKSLFGITRRVDDVALKTRPLLDFVPEYSREQALRRFTLLDEIKSRPHCQDEDLERAYRRCFQISTRHLYRPFITLSGEIQILVKNASDGYGDHAHGVAVANLILQDFPKTHPALHTFFEQKLDAIPELAKPDLSRCEWIGEAKGQRITLRIGDWFLLQADGWHKLDDVRALDEYLSDKKRGVLFIVEEAQNNGTSLKGRLFHESRAWQVSITLSPY